MTSKDLSLLFFKPKTFINNHYLSLTNKRKFLIGYMGVILGILLGNIFSMLLNLYLQKLDLTEALKLLNLDQDKLLFIFLTQKYYSIISIIISPILGFMLPHLLGGLLWILLLHKPNNNYSLNQMIDCVSFSLSSMIYYAIPVFGPFISIIMLATILSHCLKINFEIDNLFKHVAIFISIYLVLILGSEALKLLAMSLVNII